VVGPWGHPSGVNQQKRGRRGVLVAVVTPYDVTAAIWRGLGGDPGALGRLTVTGPAHVLPSVFPVTAAATGAVSAATLAVGELWRRRGGPPDATVAVDSRHAALACRSELLIDVVGEDLGDLWGPVSGVYATSDGWIRLHGNYPWHRRAALRALGLAGDGDRDPGGAGDGQVDRARLHAAVARWQATALEEAIHREGGCAAALRPIAAWRASPQGGAVAVRPLVNLMPLGPGDGERGVPPDPERPLAGLRVLDLTRVIAGPVAGRFLAAYGAEVLRLDAPSATDSPVLVADTTVGKRSAVLDLHEPSGQARFERLVRDADAVLCGYRPGALTDLGYDPDTLTRLRPGLVVGTLSAYGEVGPWGGRRGFDSLVQMVSGLADEGRRATGVEVPVPLPCQLLDHATGYLLAAGVILGLARRAAAARGGGWLVQVSLARTSCWLDGLGRSGAVDIPDPPTVLPDDLSTDLHGPLGHTRHISCPGLVVGAAPRWPTGPVPLGHDPPEWSS
jgi:crotonobetainyl-CoA:carnitine CoA-transferase CaiB-like acyl-CoA transferase